MFHRGGGLEPYRIRREDWPREEDAREPKAKKVYLSTAEAYMIFRKGVDPVVEAKLPNGEYAINVRYRAEFAVRPQDFDLWSVAWQTTVFAIVGESLDPDDFIMGAELKDKRNRGASVALRLDILFAKEDKDVCDAICGELTRMLKEKVPGLPFLFERRVPRSELGGKRAGGGGGGGGGDRGGGSAAAGASDAGYAANKYAGARGGGGGGGSGYRGGRS